MIVTPTQVTLYTDISASAGTILSSGLIPIVQERINYITNNFFLTDMAIQGEFTFNATANTITSSARFDDEGFIDGDEIYIYNSYRNDGYHTVDTVGTTTVSISSSTSVIAEKAGRDILISVVQWPTALAYLAAQMVKYDYDARPAAEPGVKSKTLGPYSVSYATSSGSNSTPYGYPQELVDGLMSYTIVRLN